ncbi:MAG: hypothetical protein U0570_12085 [Phycisphaerales bacterium]
MSESSAQSIALALGVSAIVSVFCRKLRVRRQIPAQVRRVPVHIPTVRVLLA